MIYLLLFKEFFEIGLFSFGGGFATLPFLYKISETYHWFATKEISQMLAISTITPGPIGINMATYAGMKIHGIPTALTATVSLMLPALIIVILVSKVLKKFKDNIYVKASIYALKPATCALLTAVAIRLIKESITDIYSTVLFAILMLCFLTGKRSIIFYLTVGALCGLLCGIIVKV